jgi:hypothetical protein
VTGLFFKEGRGKKEEGRRKKEEGRGGERERGDYQLFSTQFSIIVGENLFVTNSQFPIPHLISDFRLKLPINPKSKIQNPKLPNSPLSHSAISSLTTGAIFDVIHQTAVS